jgi:hypothetical protein
MMNFVLFILLFSFESRASLLLNQEQCSNVDIREVNPALREMFSTPRDQDSIGWCFGFAAADLLSAKLGTAVSAYHVSAIYNRAISRNFFWRTLYEIGDLIKSDTFSDVYEGGFIGKALKATRKHHTVCTEEQVPFDANYFGGTRQEIASLERLRGQIRSTQDRKVACELIEQSFPSDLLENRGLEQIQTSLIHDNINETLEKITSSACLENPIQIPDFDYKSLGRPSRSQRAQTKYLNAIDAALKSGKPVGISWNPGKVMSTKGGSHASSVIARRWNNGRCEYKIRNSWGPTCEAYLPEIECDRSEGAFWVKDETFHEMVNGITYIK